jgi:hypothetical protein
MEMKQNATSVAGIKKFSTGRCYRPVLVTKIGMDLQTGLTGIYRPVRPV